MWPSGSAAVTIFPVAVQVPLAGSYTSAPRDRGPHRVVDIPHEHPAVAQQRGREAPVGLEHAPGGGPGPAFRVVQLRGGHVVGIIAGKPPTTSTLPSRSRTAVWPERGVLIEPVAIHTPVVRGNPGRGWWCRARYGTWTNDGGLVLAGTQRVASVQKRRWHQASADQKGSRRAGPRAGRVPTLWPRYGHRRWSQTSARRTRHGGFLMSSGHGTGDGGRVDRPDTRWRMHDAVFEPLLEHRHLIHRLAPIEGVRAAGPVGRACRTGSCPTLAPAPSSRSRRRSAAR